MRVYWLLMCCLIFISTSALAELDQRAFKRVLTSVQTEFATLAHEHGERLQVAGQWKDDWIAANARRWDDEFIIVIYGGVARQAEVDEDVLALVFCHELGHGYGGEPYRDAYNHISVEGQADYWATQTCLPRVFKNDTAARAVRAALGLTQMFARLHKIKAPQLETPDSTQVSETTRTHLSLQCRLDTLVAGVLGQERPRCWFAGRSI